MLSLRISNFKLVRHISIHCLFFPLELQFLFMKILQKPIHSLMMLVEFEPFRLPFFLAYTGVLFPNDLKTAYAVVRICMSFGFLVSFAWGYHLCVYVKIYIHLAFQSLAIACYFVTEYLDSQKRKKELAQDAVELAEMKT